MSFATSDLIGERYEQYLAEARAKLLPDGCSAELTTVERHKLGQARKAAALRMQGEIGADAWRRWRDAQAQMSAPEVRPSPEHPGRTERVRRSPSGLRVDLLPTTQPPT